jgi:DNA-binding NarL/FixJ family response regulator
MIAKESNMRLATEASNGREAMEQFRLVLADITLLDVQMPQMGELRPSRPFVQSFRVRESSLRRPMRGCAGTTRLSISEETWKGYVRSM